jgi:GNAT superfamily N-acetyltransferase
MVEAMTLVYRVSPPLENVTLNALFFSAWPKHIQQDFGPMLRHSLAWVVALESDALLGFVNLAWDGGKHAFFLDTTGHPHWQRRGVGMALVRHALVVAKDRGLHWMHVDCESSLEPFYRACGFGETTAGLVRFS